MEYKTVFEVTEKPLDFIWIIIPAVLLLVGIGMLIYVIRGRRRVNLTGCSMLVFPTIFTSFTAIITMILILSVLTSRTNAKEVLAQGEYKIVEGVVENFDKMPYEGHKSESFTVEDVFFEYSDYMIYDGMNGFNQTASHGGPITGNGLQVRLTYVTIMNDRNIIVKIEIADD